MVAGPRTVPIGAGRLARWAAGFGERHGPVSVTVSPGAVELSGRDGAQAVLADPWDSWRPADDVADPVQDLAAHVLAPRRVAALLVRRGGYACAVVHGGRVVASKVGTRYVQGRTAAGGWSQQRFARRRAKQTDELAGAAAEVAVRLLTGPSPAQAPGWLVTGGDRPLLDAVLADPRLAGLRAAPRGVHLSIGDPRSDLVGQLPDLITQVRVTLIEP